MPDSSLDLRKILEADYHQLGVFLDSRCNSKRYARILVDVSDLLAEFYEKMAERWENANWSS